MALLLFILSTFFLSVALSNITFQMDGNMTFVPPSPITEADDVQRLFDDISKYASADQNWHRFDRYTIVLIRRYLGSMISDFLISDQDCYSVVWFYN